MKREEITPQHVNELLFLVAQLIYTEQRVKDIQESKTNYPFIQALLLDDPERIVEIFHSGSLMWDLERVAGLSWKWNVSVKEDQLNIQFYENKPTREKTEQDTERERVLNTQVAAYLLTHSR
ncbi:MAG: hypothetical protein ABI758_00440 [Candidatus Woesebacteria bacterium]